MSSIWRCERSTRAAVYSGFGVAVALALTVAARFDSLRPGAVARVSLALAGTASSRLVSALFERPGRWPWIAFAIEVSGALALSITHFS